MVAFARRQPGKAGSRRPMSVKHALLMGCIGIIVLLCIRNNLIIGMGMGHPQASEIQRVSNVGQTLKFVQYRPSKLEQDWYDKKQEYDLHPSEICKDLAHHTEEMRSWISFLDHDQGDNSDVDDGVFSRLVFEDNNGNEYTKIIEPLVGHFRHPYGLPHCKPEGNAVQAQDRSYIAFGGARKVDSSFFPGKRYLFDLGTAKFNSSLRYLISRYSELGIEFDSIWAWEAKPLSNYWKSVPHNVQGNLHFYNQAITSDLNSASHPLQILKRIYKHGDFVVCLRAAALVVCSYVAQPLPCCEIPSLRSCCRF